MLADLNKQQQQAAEFGNGPLVVIAGPGTGKTKTLTTRVVYLLESGRAKPNEILALTFTNKAVNEMRERVSGLVRTNQLPNIVTFHGLCHQLLCRDKQEVQFVSEHERLLLIKQLRKNAQLRSLATRELALEISRLKNLPPTQIPADHPLLPLLHAYNQQLRERNLYDFDDLLQQTHTLLRQTNNRPSYKYILVDEFQDTNRLQYELLLLLKSNDNLCAIGDPLQSIYGFRGADGSIFERFMTDFPASKTITLTTNYRSTPQVVALANATFPTSNQLMAHTRATGRVATTEVLNEYSEAAWIINQVEQAVGGSDLLRAQQLEHNSEENARSFGDFAILYRTRQTGKTVQRALAESGLPFQIVGEGSPYEQPDIWAIIQLLGYLAEPSEDRMSRLQSLPIFKSFSTGQLQDLLKTWQPLTTKKVSQLATTIAEGLSTDSLTIDQFIGSLVRFDEAGLAAYVQYVDKLADTTFYEPTADAITLTTIHAAKGLEFNHVFLLAAEEGILPHARSGWDEEKRLFYVALTRARHNLDILHARTRGGQPATISPFVAEFSNTILTHAQDEAMSTDQRRLQKRRAKRAQTTLFDPL